MNLAKTVTVYFRTSLGLVEEAKLTEVDVGDAILIRSAVPFTHVP